MKDQEPVSGGSSPQGIKSSPFSSFLAEVGQNPIRVLTFILGVIFVIALLAGIFNRGGRFLLLLKDIEVSRGLITFLIALTTVLLTIILVLYAITSQETNKEAKKENFLQGKEVLTTLVGILGTVLGFYFGTAENSPRDKLSVAGIKFRDMQLVTHISGGTSPYRYSITSPRQQIESRLSSDGWIMEELNGKTADGDVIKLYVCDATDKIIEIESRYSPKAVVDKDDQKSADSVTVSTSDTDTPPSVPVKKGR